MPLSRLPLLFALSLGCTSTPGDDDDSTAPDEPGRLRQPEVCASVTPSVSLDPDGGSLVQTEHYRLHLRGVDEDEAIVLGQLAETAWEGWQAYFPTPFDLGADDPFEAYLEADFAAFQARLQADGLDADDAGGAGGYYHPSTRRAYLYQQPTVWYTRVLFLHELAHQAHRESRGSSNPPPWYVEGLAEYLSRHDWDGQCLRLGVTPQLSLEDRAQDALIEGPAELGPWFDEGAWQGRPLAMALFRFLSTDPELGPGWDGLRAAIDDAGETSSEEVEAALGLTLPELEQRMTAFVAQDQEPMVPVYLEWLHRTPTSVRGWADGVISIARHKDPPAEVSLVSEPPLSGSVGLLLSWDSGSDYDALVLEPGGALWTFNAVGGSNSWNPAGSVDPPGASVSWTLTHEGNQALVTIDGEALAIPIGASTAVGLAVENDDVIFSELSWRP